MDDGLGLDCRREERQRRSNRKQHGLGGGIDLIHKDHLQPGPKPVIQWSKMVSPHANPSLWGRVQLRGLGFGVPLGLGLVRQDFLG